HNGFYYLANGIKGAALLTALFLALAAAPAVSGEMAQGTLRVSLARPVPRKRLFAAKALVLAAFVQALLLAGGVAALAGAGLVGGFGAVAKLGLVKSTAAAMTGRLAFAVVLSELAILGTLGLALLASTIADSAASATSATLGILVVIALVAFWFDPS